MLGIIIGWVMGQWKKNEHKIKISAQSRKEGYAQGCDEGRTEGWENGWNCALNDTLNWCEKQIRKNKP